MANPLQYSCLGNPMDREAWQTTVHGLQKQSKLWSAYRLRDALIAQATYMSAMREYVKMGGKSRGSAIYTSAEGEAPAKMEDVFRFVLDSGDFDTTVLEINYANDLSAATRPVRPLPEGGGFFENVWREYRENKNIY